MRRLVLAAAAALALAVGVAAPAAAAPATQLPAQLLPAGVVQSGNTITKTVNPCSCTATFDGYVFVGLPYYDPSPANDSAVELWWLLTEQPGYVAQPTVTSISTTTTVSGTVTPTPTPDPPDDGGRSSWG